MMQRYMEHRREVRRALEAVASCDTPEARDDAARRLWEADGAHVGDCLLSELDDLLARAAAAREDADRARPELAVRLELLAHAFGAGFVEPALELAQRVQEAGGRKAVREALAAQVLNAGVAPALRALSERMEGAPVLRLARGARLEPLARPPFGSGPGWRACHEDPGAALHAGRKAVRAAARIVSNGAGRELREAAALLERLAAGERRGAGPSRPAAPRRRGAAKRGKG